MQNSPKITIYGAGAIGCTLAARLILAGHQQVSLIARGDNQQILTETGIILDDLTGVHHVHPYTVVEHPEQLEAQDYIFIATKFDALHQITADLKTLLHDHTVIVPLMNGIPFWYFFNADAEQVKPIHALDPHATLVNSFPLKHLIGAVVFITAKLIDYGQVESKNPYLLIFGEPNHQMSERLNQLVALFAGTEIEARPVPTIRDQIWTKVMANLSSNPLSVVSGATLADIYAHPHLQAIASDILQEVRQVAACYGARIGIDPPTFLKMGAEMGQTYTSMWYDYQKKHPLELKSIADAVFELAHAYDCPMPTTQHIYHLTQYLSETSRHAERE